jgi:hypothetical protein
VRVSVDGPEIYSLCRNRKDQSRVSAHRSHCLPPTFHGFRLLIILALAGHPRLVVMRDGDLDMS